MEFKIIEKDEKNKKIVFRMSGISSAYANTLRRAILTETPVMAIEEVTIKKNSTVLYDEMIAHRLGLVPLTTDYKSYNFKNNCTCKGAGCSRCQVKFTLIANKEGLVYSKELKTDDPHVEPVYGNIPLLKLGKNQDLELYASAELGYGREHMKWSPGHIFFINEPTIHVDEKKLSKNIELYPPEIEDAKLDKNYFISNPHILNACYNISDAIEITFKDDSFIFYLESWGQLDCEEIVKLALENLNKKLEELEGHIK